MLLPARDVAVLRGVLHAHGDVVGAGVYEGGDVELEGRVTAFMLAAEPAVGPHRGAVIDGAEVQQDAAAFPFIGQQEHAAIPDIGVEAWVADAAFGAFEAKRHQDRLAEILGAVGPIVLDSNVFVVELELPGAVQVQPLFALKLGLRVFRAGNGLVEMSGPERELPNW